MILGFDGDAMDPVTVWPLSHSRRQCAERGNHRLHAKSLIRFGFCWSTTSISFVALRLYR